MSIRVTLALRPYGTGEPETIGILEIGNRNATGDVCDYDYRFTAQTPDGPLRFGPWHVVRAHDRRKGVWVLVGQILARRAAGDEELSDYAGE
jgi:hypothetical protein